MLTVLTRFNRFNRTVLRRSAVCAVAVLVAGVAAAGCIPEPAPEQTTEPADAAPTPAAKVKTTTPATPSPTTPSLPPLEQPAEWEDPELLEHPGEDATTYEQLEYEMVNQVWVAAGIRAATEVTCDVDQDELLIPGDYEYECITTYNGVDVPYAVTTTTTDETSTSYHTTDFLPITREKATHELTRQALEPAEVSCEMDDIQLVRLDDPEALLCEVADIRDETTLYYGEISGNGGVFFAPAG